MDEKCRSRFTYNECPVRDILEGKIAALTVETRLHFDLNDSALVKTERILEERLARMNEFRDALKDQAATFITRTDYLARNEAVQRQLDEEKVSRATLSGRASMMSVWGSYALALMGVLMSAVALLSRMKIQP